MTAPLLVATVAAVGVLHTLVPDHWAPIVVIGRQQGWSVARAARAAAIAGFGHVTSTLVLGLILWAVGATLAVRYGHAVNLVAAAALVAFGTWIGYAGWRELREGHGHGHDHVHLAHAHVHQHADGTQHVHWHEHDDADLHPINGGVAVMHEHDHRIAGRTALLLILGSSPMIEGIPGVFRRFDVRRAAAGCDGGRVRGGDHRYVRRGLVLHHGGAVTRFAWPTRTLRRGPQRRIRRAGRLYGLITS